MSTVFLTNEDRAQMVLEFSPSITSTIQGPIVSITDAAAVPAASIVSTITATQEGEGTPSPDNIRSIAGWDTVQFWHGAVYNAEAEPRATMELSETVYGGTLDWNTGVFTTTHFVQTFDGTEEWTVSTDGFYQYYNATLYAKTASTNQVAYHVCSHFKADRYRVYDSAPDNSCHERNNNKLMIKCSSIATLEDWIAYLAAQAAAGTPVTIVWEYLPTKYTTTQLTPQQLTMLKGDNALWSDTGDTAVTYVVDTKEYIDNTNAVTEEHIKAASEKLYKDQYPIVLSVELLEGGIDSTGGIANQLPTRARTGWLGTKYLYVDTDPSIEYMYFYYAANTVGSYIGYSGEWLSGASCATDYDIFANAQEARVLLRKSDNSNITDASALADLIEIRTKEESVPDPYGEYESDVPESMGVLNTVLNFKQLSSIKYTPLATLPQLKGDYAAGVERTGLPYSSSRIEAGFVPNFISLHTFMTALKNPNSYLYTVDLGDLGNVNGHTYYGVVCSTSCGYALGLTPNYSTHQWGEIPGMQRLECQSVYALKIGDTICGNGHVVMVTDITRNKRGRIGSISITEAAMSRVVSNTYTPERVAELYPTSTHTYYRYSQIHAVNHTQSPYVAVEDEIPQEVVYNTAIIPRKGDKANWLLGVPVEIDVLEPGNYTSIEVYKDETLYSTVDIASLITLSNLPYGSYKARLTDGTNTSDWCYWMVVDAASTVTATGTAGEIRVDFSVSNAEPLFVAWNRSDNNGTVHINSLTAEDLEAGSTICSYETGSYKVRVAFRTEYGIIHSVLSDIVTV